MRNDYVTQLLSGSIDEKGKFVPYKVNPYGLLGDLVRSSNKPVHEIMVKEGLWNPLVDLDESVHLKTKAEKLELKELKSAHKKKLIKAGFNPKKRLNLSEPAILTV